MANVIFEVGGRYRYDFSDFLDPIFNSPVSDTPEQVQFDTPSGLITLSGSGFEVFIDEGGNLFEAFSGTISGLTYVKRGVTVATFTGLDLPLTAFVDAVGQIGTEGALDLILAGDDTMTGSNDADLMSGALGQDVLFGRKGDDMMSGGSMLLGAFDSDGIGNDDTLFGGSGDDTIFGVGGGDALYGGNGNDFLFAHGSLFEGDAAANLIFGNAGNDGIVGDFGDDQIFGGKGRDEVAYDVDVDVRVDLALRTAQDTGQGLDRLISIENLSTSIGADTLLGNGSANLFSSLAGDDLLEGQAGNDTIIAGSGADTLTGGNGVDLLKGGSGADLFVFQQPGLADRLPEFDHDLDTIALNALTFTGFAGTDLTADAFVLGIAATTSDHRVIYDPTTGNLSYDSDGTGIALATLFARLAIGATLDHTDITFATGL